MKAILACAVALLAVHGHSQTYALTNLGVGFMADGIAKGDLDGDGDLDALVAIAGLGGRADLLRGNGAGGFTVSSITLGNFQTYNSVAIGDIDGDGDLDAVFGSKTGAFFSVMINNGAAAFTAGQLTNVNPNPPERVALADINNDSNLDLLLVDRINSRIQTYIGTGFGAFTAATVFPVQQLPFDVAIGDLNGDGNVDLVTASAGAFLVSRLLGNGMGGFTRVDFGVGLQTHAVGLGDLNGDGFLDLVAASQFSNAFARLLGNGAGGFGTATQHGTGGTGPTDIQVSDFNDDGNLDVAVSHLNTNNLTIVRGNGLGGFPNPPPPLSVTLTGASQTMTMFAGDVNIDGRQDMLLANLATSNVSVLRNTVGTPQNISVFGSGTPGCYGRLGINANLPPRVNTPNWHVLVSNAPPLLAGTLFASPTPDVPGTVILGARFHVVLSGAISLPAVSDEAGFATVGIPIPNDPTLVGAMLSFQGAWIEPASNRCATGSSGIVTSLGMTATVF